MSVPKRHHFVPERLQQHFSNGEGGLWTFSSRNRAKGVWCGTVENHLVEGHLYSHVESDGTKDTSLETRFAMLEGGATPIIAKITSNARNERLPWLTRREREIWEFFLYQQYRGVSDLYSSLLSEDQRRVEVENRLAELVRSGYPLSNSESCELLEPATLKRMYKNLRVATLKTGSEAVLAAIAQRGIAVAKIASDKKSFVLGSRPVVKLTLPDATHLSDTRVEMWLAVAHDIMVGLGLDDHQEMLVPVSPQQVRHCNEAAAKQSSQIVGRSQALVQSLARFAGTRTEVACAAEAWTAWRGMPDPFECQTRRGVHADRGACGGHDG